MIKIENVVLPTSGQWRAIILGARNPMNSWSKSDSKFGRLDDCSCECSDCNLQFKECAVQQVGRADRALMMKLRNAGTDHRKFMRMITVYMDITAPLYWWKEFDTYKVGTVANSCSTMHKIHAKEFTMEDFSHEHLALYEVDGEICRDFKGTLECTIDDLNVARELYLETKDKKYWNTMIQLLPNSYNQKRTVMLNYEVLANMYHSRKNHKLDEWRDFCSWVETLPYSELITGE